MNKITRHNVMETFLCSPQRIPFYLKRTLSLAELVKNIDTKTFNYLCKRMMIDKCNREWE